MTRSIRRRSSWNSQVNFWKLPKVLWHALNRLTTKTWWYNRIGMHEKQAMNKYFVWFLLLFACVFIVFALDWKICRLITTLCCTSLVNDAAVDTQRILIYDFLVGYDYHKYWTTMNGKDPAGHTRFLRTGLQSATSPLCVTGSYTLAL